MVSKITAGGSPVDDRGRPFSRRRLRPALLTFGLLLILAVVAWSVALTGTEADETVTDCNQPTRSTEADAPAPLRLDIVRDDEMLGVDPAPLSTFQVRVLNASTLRGQARSVSDDLSRQGFNPVADTAYADDPVYPNQDLDCVAQIRYGAGAERAAAALWLAIPCAQLVRDERAEPVVDVAIGEQWISREQSQDAQAALEVLRSADPKKETSGVEPSLIEAVHSQSC